MFNENEVLLYLKNHLNEKRYNHTLSTADCAAKLAQRYNVDKEKTQIAAILHDCAKWMDNESLIENAIEYGIKLDDMQMSNPDLLHSYVGVNIAKAHFGIIDEEILNAICHHTIPVPNMTDLAKIIYIADKIERTRINSRAKELRAMTEISLDNLFFETLKSIKIWHIENDKVIHTRSVQTYNSILYKIYNED